MSSEPAKSGLMLVLSAPSGAGKTTLARRLVAETPEAVISVSYTTRRPRGGEKDGADYYFVGPDEFADRVERGEFLEWADVHGERYGSHNRYAEVAAQGRLVVFVIDVQGGASVKSKFPDAPLVFVLPPGQAELERRLRERRTDSEETIQRRLHNARSEISRGLAVYDYVVVNDDLTRAVDELRAIVRAELCRRGRAAQADFDA